MKRGIIILTIFLLISLPIASAFSLAEFFRNFNFPDLTGQAVQKIKEGSVAVKDQLDVVTKGEILTCKDETEINECSKNKPLYCDENQELIAKCEECGCAENYECKDTICIKIQIEQPTITKTETKDELSETEIEKNETEEEPLTSGKGVIQKTTLYIQGVGGLVASKDVDGLKYYNSDHLGNIKLITNEAGYILNEENQYLAFGEPIYLSDDSRFSYNVKELDDSGLYYYGARYYDSEIGRFTTVDPIKGNIQASQSLNRYTYTRNNPMKYIDPTGAQTAEADATKVSPENTNWQEGSIRALTLEEGISYTLEYLSRKEVSGKILAQASDFVPGSGDIKGIVEGVIGEDLATGEDLSLLTRGLCLICLSEFKYLSKAKKVLKNIDLFKKGVQLPGNQALLKALVDVKTGDVRLLSKGEEHIDVAAEMLGVGREALEKNPEIANNIVGASVFFKEGTVRGVQVGGSGLTLGARVPYSPKTIDRANEIMSEFVYGGEIPTKLTTHQVIYPKSN
jgi:RHS repeat-associated protein